MSDSLLPHGLQHARPLCPSPTPEFSETHVCWVGDAIQPSHPLSSPFPAAFNLSQHQSLFQGFSYLHQLAEVLEFQHQHHSLQRNPRADLLQNGLVGYPCIPRDTFAQFTFTLEESLRAGGEGDNRGWHGWMASPTQWTWVWVNSGSWWWTERPGVLQFMGLQTVGHDWATKLNWTDA